MVSTNENVNNWCSNPDGKSWNVAKAEDDISSITRFLHFYRLSTEEQEKTPNFVKVLYSHDPEMLEAAVAAVEEMLPVYEGKTNVTGCHLTHSVSGNKVYSLFENDVVAYTSIMECDTEEDAKAAIVGREDAIIEQDHGKYQVLVVDEDETERLRDLQCSGTFVGDFKTLEEAEDELAGLEDGYIVEYPADEWWMVVNDKTQKSMFELAFPSRLRAIAFLYKATMPPAWTHYLEVIERKTVEWKKKNEEMEGKQK